MKSYLIGKFWHPDHVMNTLAQLRESGIKARDVFAPFPIHNIEPLLDIKRTRLLTAAFVYGALGTFTAVFMISLIYGVIWPMDIGGKPTLPFTDYVPITFELTVLFSAHGMVLTFLIVSEYWPGKKAVIIDPRQTDDIFVIAIEKDKLPYNGEAAAIKIMQANEAFEVTETQV